MDFVLVSGMIALSGTGGLSLGLAVALLFTRKGERKH